MSLKKYLGNEIGLFDLMTFYTMKVVEKLDITLFEALHLRTFLAISFFIPRAT